MFVVRHAEERDLSDLFDLAALLDTMNLPHDRGVIEELVDRSRRSFAGLVPPEERLFMFVLVDDEADRVIGTSAVHAQHGTRRAPHVFFEVLTEDRYSETIDRHVRHRVLRIGYDFDGPSEIGGLILDPHYRRRGGRLGTTLSFARFLYMAANRRVFRQQVLAELLPPLEPDGSSLLWNHLGRGFTGMSYQEADRLSQKNKEFIRALFPQGAIYTSMLPAEVQAQIGEIGPRTKGVERMLRAIGFQYANRIDPFDGGPHFVAPTDGITIVREARALQVSEVDVDAGDEALVAAARDGDYRACRSVISAEGDALSIPHATRARLGLATGDVAWVSKLSSNVTPSSGAGD